MPRKTPKTEKQPKAAVRVTGKKTAAVRLAKESEAVAASIPPAKADPWQERDDQRVLLEVPPAPETGELQGAWDALKEAEREHETEEARKEYLASHPQADPKNHTVKKQPLFVPKATDDDLRRFVDDFLSDRIFTSAHLRNNEEEQMLSMVFMPIALGAFSTYTLDSLAQIGVLWEDMSKAGPRSCNGRPMFMSFHILHIEDWKRALAAIHREEERRKSIEL